jgi:predicted phosphodiesterase
LRQAIVSDIHGNEVALHAVLADIESQKVDEVVCLGDVIGYGPKPRQCLASAMRYKLTLLGNHEEAVLFGAVGFNDKAKKAIDWTREELLSGGGDHDARQLWDFIGSLRKSEQEGDVAYVHGSPRDPTREYVFAQDRFDQHKMNEIFASFDGRACFLGHTHIPGVFEEDYSFRTPRDMGDVYALGKGKALVNVGSVGQPRDGDPRACYVIFDFETVRYRRVEYDLDKAVGDFASTPLPAYLSRRLREGK